MSHRTSTHLRRRRTGLGTAAVTVLLATSLAACGSDDDKTTSTSASTTGATTTATTAGGTTTTGGTSTTAQTGGGGAPGADEAAIRAAIEKGAAATKAAKTAHISLKIEAGPLVTSAEGDSDLVEQRYALDQTVEQGGKKIQVTGYGEKGKVYIQLAGSDKWQVTENPVDTSDPLAQVNQLKKAEITSVGGVETLDGAQCRRFEAKIKIADAVGNAKDGPVKQLLEAAPKGATIPVSACVDADGLTRSVDEDYEPADVFGSAAAGTPRTKLSVRISKYGEVPAPKRPAGIDDATPVASGLTG